MALPTEPQEPRVFDTEPDVPAEGNPAVNGQPETYRIFDTPGPEVRTGSVGPHTEYEPLYQSVLIGKPIEVVQPMIEAGATQALEANNQATIAANRRELVEDFVAHPEVHPGLEQLQAEIEAIPNLSKYAPSSVVAMLTSQDPVQQRYAVQRIGRLMTANTILQRRLAQASEEGFLTNWDFVDFALSSAQNYFLLDKQTEFAERASDLMYDTTKSPEEFEAEFTGILDEMAAQGFFNDDNRFYLNDFVELFAAGTGSSEARAQRAWAIFDTLSFGVGAIPATLKTTTAVGRVLRAPGQAVADVRTAAGTALEISRNPMRFLSAMRDDPDLVHDVLKRHRDAEKMETADLLHTQTHPSIVTPTTSRPTYMAHPMHIAAARTERNSAVFERVREVLARTGSAMDDPRVKILEGRLQADAALRAKNSGDLSYIDSNISVDFRDNVFFHTVRGTDEGAAFVGEEGLTAAQKLADQIGGEVAPWQQNGQYVVVETQPVRTQIGDLSKDDLAAFTATNPDELADNFVARWVGSPGTQTTEANRAALLVAEGIHEVAMSEIGKMVRAVARTVPRAGRKEVDKVFARLRDGDWADRREALNEAEFRTHFALTNGKPPTDNQVALFLRVQDAQDAEALLLADEAYKAHVADGVRVLNNEYLVVPRTADDITDSSKVWDTTNERFVDAKELPPGHTVYENIDPKDQPIFGVKAKYYTGDALNTRRLYHSDVMAVNTGGARIYRSGEINFYIKQERTTRLDDGSVVEASPVTAMGVKTPQEAAAAKKQLNAINDDVAAALGKTDFTNDEVLALRGNRELNAAIARNSDWNPSVYNVHTLVKWADENGIQLSKKFESVMHGQKLLEGSFFKGAFARMPFDRAMDAVSSLPKARRNKPLMGYGGKKLRTYDPMKAMEIRRSEVLANESYKVFMTRAVNGLLKSAIRNKVLENVDDLKGLTLRQKLQKAQIRSNPGTVGAKLELERQKILARLDRRGLGDYQWELVMNHFSNFLYNKGFDSLSYGVANISSTNPLTAMRGFVFDAKLGMFNPAQLYVQASQVINILAVGGKEGLRGGALYPPVRWALANGDPKVIRSIGDRVGPAMGITADEFVDMVEMFRDHGRSTVGVSLAEFGSDAATASSIIGENVGRIREKGRFFFNEGELVARTTAWNTAYLEYLKAFPGRSPRAQHGVRWIMNRQDTLTQAMTGVSRIGVDKLPFTQFMSYQFRINEAIFAGSMGGKQMLTKAERARLAMAHTVVFGASGWAVSGVAMDWYNYRYGTDLDEGVYRAVRKGALDYFLSMTGAETSLSSRLGSGDNMFMLMKDMFENNIWETLGGPSLEVTSEALRVIIGGARNLAKGVTTGDFEDLGESLGRFARTFSTGNQAYNAYLAFRVGQYLTKDNALLDNNLTDMEAMMVALGVPLEDHEEAFKFNTFAKVEKLFLSSTIKSAQREWNMYNSLLARGDHAEAQEVMKGLSLLLHSLPTHDRNVVWQEIRRTGGSIVDNVYMRELQYELARDFGEE